jgi:hypothetical protein
MYAPTFMRLFLLRKKGCRSLTSSQASSADEHELRNIFTQFGPLWRVSFHWKERYGEFMLVAFVIFSGYLDAQRAYEVMALRFSVQRSWCGSCFCNGETANGVLLVYSLNSLGIWFEYWLGAPAVTGNTVGKHLTIRTAMGQCHACFYDTF